MNSKLLRFFFFLFFFSFVSFQSFSQSDYLEAVAQKGDGIFSILRRHGLDFAQYQEAFLKLNEDKLGKNKGLIAGKKYLLPPKEAATSSAAAATKASAAATKAASRKGMDPSLFGKKYEQVTVRNQQLQGAVYYLSAGHGGPDPGAVGKYGSYSLPEDEYAYDVTLRLARRLMEHGATVYMIIQDPDDGIRDEAILKLDQDEETYPGKTIPLSQKYRLRHRIDAVNKLHAQHKGAYQRMLAIHVDSRSARKNIDVFFYHYETNPHGKRLADNIHQTFTDKYKRYQPYREYSGNVSHRNNLYVVKYSQVPTVFIELGNIRNSLDQRRFVIADNRQALANWICDGIIADYKSRD
ncbi:N-acetylmuramoyl-L-alanine amidase family protein [Botryobacter ruber]|uniref:N-acetylmuramoyl-L-alanine amidase family protein n=1 Tax=Botryobacter ruber TaxID=2171629 RepID=UPI000E0B9FF8|nr:N-acetylmuramoyl-L-alanine amidase [Botryobacter ruber]